MTIQKLSQSSVNSLISSSSIFSTSAVVKELIDNSIDAQGHNIQIEVDGATGGLQYCMVKDDGVGVNAVDRDLMCCNCTTSKLEPDLFASGKLHFLEEVSTLGFRGEALFFISQTIQLDVQGNGMTITSRTSLDKLAEQWSIAKNGGIDGLRRPVAAEVGTCICVTGLFSAFTVRRNILQKQASKLIDEIRNIIISYSLTYPKLRFSLKIVDYKSQGKIGQSSAYMKKNLSLSASSSRASSLGLLCKIRNVKKSFIEDSISNLEDEKCPVKFKVHYTLPIMKGDTEVSSVKNVSTFLSINGRPIDRSRSVIFKNVANILRNIYKEFNLLKPLVWNLIIEIDNVKDVDINIEPLKDDVLIFRQDKFLDSLLDLLTPVIRELHGYVDEEIDQPTSDGVLEDSKFTVSNLIAVEDDIIEPLITIKEDVDKISDVILVEAKDDKEVPVVRQDDEDDEDTDWQYNTLHSFSDGIEPIATTEYDERENTLNEDITISNDITLSNPFIYSKITQSNTTSTPDTSINESTLVHASASKLKPTRSPLQARNVKEILTGNTKRPSQLPITAFMAKKAKPNPQCQRKLSELSENTLNCTEECIIPLVYAISDDSIDVERYEGDLNRNIVSWYALIGAKLVGEEAELIADIPNDLKKIAKLDYQLI